MRFKDQRIKSFIGDLRDFCSDLDVYTLETMNCARDATIYIYGTNIRCEIVRLKFSPAHLIVKAGTYNLSKILELWQKNVDTP